MSWFRGLLGNTANLKGHAEVPNYWKSRSKLKDSDVVVRQVSGDLESFYPVQPDDRKVLEVLMNRTCKSSDISFRLVRAVRLENPDLWERYQNCVARAKRKRGRCAFAGRGAPVTREALEGVHLSDGFPQELDSEVCEAYLWHGTKPHVASRIVRSGFKVNQHSALGKRFGKGGYFSEDAAKADTYAGAGEGIYKDCFAMLLCRVVLGRQLHTNAFRWEDAAQQAGSRYDAILAEPKGSSFREFVALEDAQIYPEFALVYERCPAPELADGPSLARSLSPHVPPYWSNAASGATFFHGTFADSEVESCVQSLMDVTWVNAFTWERRDSSGSILQYDDPHHDMPEGLTVLKVLRLEDSDLWGEYCGARQAIREARGECLASPSAEGAARTSRSDLPLCARARLAAGLNEVYLWHGCSPQVITSIAERGFPVQPGRGGTGRCEGMFGDGYYFVDSASKADEHSEDDKEGYYSGHYAMLLCRVLLGATGVLEGADLHAHEKVGRDREFDSVVGYQEASDGTFREFVVQERTQIYPEYAIIYERMYSDDRIR